MENIGNVIVLSESGIIEEAVSEWFFNGEIEYAIGKCEYCNRRNLQMRLKILNRVNNNELYIGQKCLIKLFNLGLRCFDHSDNSLELEDLKNFLNDCRYMLRKEDIRLKTIGQLEELNEYCNTSFLIEGYKTKGYFEIFDVLLLMDLFEKYCVEYNEKVFNISIKRKEDKAVFLSLKEDEYRRLYPCLSNYQRKYYQERKDF